jgi:hypothetical protein
MVYHTAEEIIEEPTLNEVKQALRGLKNNKAPGVDMIAAELIKKGGPKLEEHLYQLIRNIWDKETLPKEWKMGIIVPILKKGDKTKCENYRGITLLNTAYKVFSSILYARLLRYTESILGEYQCGFRPNRSTIDHIHLMRQTMEKAYEYNMILYHVFIDFKQAFDSINREKMLHALKLLGIPSKLGRLIHVSLTESKAVINIQNELTDHIVIESGVRQGDALSTMMFNLVLEAIARKVDIRGCVNSNTSQMCAYADDIVITSRSKQRLIDHATTLKKEAEKLGLEINACKTKYMVSTREQGPPRNICVEQQVWEEVQSFTYLGSNLNTLNKTTEEVNIRLIAANKCFYACKGLLSSKILSKNSKLLIYKTVIRPVATYGCETWCLIQREEHKLAIFERKILRRIFGPTLENGSYRIKMNHELEELIKHETVVKFCRSQRLRWAGHVERMPEHRTPKIMTKWIPQWKRSRGRPKKRWADCIEEDWRKMGRAGDWRGAARERSVWRTIVEEAKSRPGM